MALTIIVIGTVVSIILVIVFYHMTMEAAVLVTENENKDGCRSAEAASRMRLVSRLNMEIAEYGSVSRMVDVEHFMCCVLVSVLAPRFSSCTKGKDVLSEDVIDSWVEPSKTLNIY